MRVFRESDQAEGDKLEGGASGDSLSPNLELTNQPVNSGELGANHREGQARDLEANDDQLIVSDFDNGGSDTIAANSTSKIKKNVLRVSLISAGLYGFFLGMDLIGTAAKILGARSTAGYFDVVNDDAGAWALGELFTVAVQSSSTATSVIIKLVGEGELDKNRGAIMVMAANWGTSITNTLINFVFLWIIMRIKDLQEKREKIKDYAKSFTETSQHELFNIYSTILNATLQSSCGLFTLAAGGLTDLFNITNDSKPSEGIDFLKTIVAPTREFIISSSSDCIKLFTQQPKTASCKNLSAASSGIFYEWFDEHGSGVATLSLGLFSLSVSLVVLTKTLNNIFEGPIRGQVQRLLDGSHPMSLLMIGIVGTVLVQSSSVFTSALAILIHQRIITRDQSLLLQMGSNVGTCATGLVSASTASKQEDAFQVAFVHLLFNIPGLFSYFAREKMYHFPVEKGEEILNKKPVLASIAWTSGIFIIIPVIILTLSLTLNPKPEDKAEVDESFECPATCSR